MKHLLGLWQTVADYTVPVRGTTAEEFEAMFRSCDDLITAKINKASMVSIDVETDVLLSSLESVTHQLVVKISAMEPEDQTAAAERARRLVTTAVKHALNDAMDTLATPARSARNETKH